MTSDSDQMAPIRVLICDDVYAIRRLLCVIIEHEPGINVVGQAEDGEQAITAAARLQPDVILLDLSMRELTGLDALPEIKQLSPDSKVIIFTGFAASVFAADLLTSGADRYLEKGASPTAVVAAIREVVAVERSVSADDLASRDIPEVGGGSRG